MDESNFSSRETRRRNFVEPIFPVWKGPLAYSLALTCVAVAFAIRLLLAPSLPQQAPYLFFAPAVLIAAAFGGFGPGIAATAISLVLGLSFFASLPDLSQSDVVSAVAFALIGVGSRPWATGCSGRARTWPRARAICWRVKRTCNRSSIPFRTP